MTPTSRDPVWRRGKYLPLMEIFGYGQVSPGDPTDPASDFGPLSSEGAAERLLGLAIRSQMLSMTSPSPGAASLLAERRVAGREVGGPRGR
jgi:hypothetical protein